MNKLPAVYDNDTAIRWLTEAMNLHENEKPFPWQIKLLERFCEGDIPAALDIPTGLGKTAVMAIWLIARAVGADLPRRLVYIVDRRAVVDQATEIAYTLHDFVGRNDVVRSALMLNKRGLPISTLRGKFIDNQAWRENPAAPGIIVGTVDMIGSRLLFEGYGVSRKTRPYHAGLLGVDTLLVLDEAHLVPPFENLLKTISKGNREFGPDENELKSVIPPMRFLSLSATGRSRTSNSFRLTDRDLDPGSIPAKRIDSKKFLRVLSIDAATMDLSQALASEAWKLAGDGSIPARVIVFCDKRKTAQSVRDTLEKYAKGDKGKGIPAVTIDTELLVGGRRVYEREITAEWLKIHGFTGPKKTAERASFVIATSAGEVGVDIDAEHMVSDLVSWERMVQRLGRVNRRGETQALVVVVIPHGKGLEKGEQDWSVLKKPLDCLPEIDGFRSACPRAIMDLNHKAEMDDALCALITAATTPETLRPALTRPLIDAWSLTALKHHPGRPEIRPWLRGWLPNDPPQTRVVWRKYLPVRKEGPMVIKKEIESFFEAANPHQSELLETETFHVIDWLFSRVSAILKDEEAAFGRKDVIGFAISTAFELKKVIRCEDCMVEQGDKSDKKNHLEKALINSTLIIAAEIGGLNSGMLDSKEDKIPVTADGDLPWISEEPEQPVIEFRVTQTNISGALPPIRTNNWLHRYSFVQVLSAEGLPLQWITISKWRYHSSTEDDRSSGREQLLSEHHEWTKSKAKDLGIQLGLPNRYAEMLVIAAGLHDTGKRSARWQRAFRAKENGIYAKAPGPIDFCLLDGYRHELGSMAMVNESHDFACLPDDLKDLALHLIASHHGFGRPGIYFGGCDDAPPSQVEKRAGEVALRFARLQKRWGPWGLAWWESLLKAADQQASRDNASPEPELGDPNYDK